MIILNKNLPLIHFNSFFFKGKNFLKGINFSLKYSLLNKSVFAFGQASNLIKNLDDIQKASDFLTKKKYNQSIEFYARSFDIIPLFIKGDDEYNKDLNLIINGFIRSCIYLQKYQKINVLFKNIKSNLNQGYTQMFDQANMRVLSILQNQQMQDQSKQTFLSKILGVSAKIEAENSHEIYKDLLKKGNKTESQLLPNNLLGLMNEDIKQTFVFTLNQLLVNPKFRQNVNYYKFCNKLLQRCQKFDKSNLIKALTIISINLLAKDQYLQAEGMLNYCISLKKETFSLDILSNNQEYILCNLLLSQLYRRVQRESEADRIQEEFKSKLSYRSLKIQSLCLNSIE